MVKLRKRETRGLTTIGDLAPTYLCGDVECKEFGQETSRSGRCRCGMERLEKEEWEILTKYWGIHPTQTKDEDEDDDAIIFEPWRGHHSDDGPTLGRSLPSPPMVSTPANNVWDIPPCLNSCPVAPQAHIYIPDVMFKQWVDLAKEFDTEWIAYLQGIPVPDKPFSYEITGMTFPKQRASDTDVRVEDGERAPEGTVAAVHSHVDFNVFFSSTDEKHFNWPIEVVVNRRGEVKANGLTTLECGRPHRGEAKIWLLGRETFCSLATSLKSVLSEDRNSVVSSVSGGSVQINYVKG